ncbi:MAG: PepSY-like domain-containing protein [Flavobacterium sp.]|nr:PepSY-like domain-containing protein [Flavobacterium sp.]
MKKLFIVSILFSALALGQKKGIPAVVQNAFSKSFPTVTKVKWEKEDGNFEAGFKENGIEKSVLLSSKGEILETESSIMVTELSKKITDYVAKNYPNKKIKGGAKIIDAKNKVSYEAEIKDLDLLFDEKGDFIKVSKD